ncbi:MAG: LysM domain-containing protein [Succiniclasticum sp.]|jgi:LysM repeat protein
MKKSLLAFLLGAILSAGFTYVHVSASPVVYDNQAITVHTGDTLWTIASHWSRPDEDVREVIDRIRTANQLSDTRISAGQQLVVPVRRDARPAKAVTVAAR